MPDDRLTKQVYECTRLQCKNNWIGSFESALPCLGLDAELVSESVINVNLVSEKLCEQEAVEWKAVVEQKPKLRTYKRLQAECKPALHITSNLPKRQRSLIHRLRTGTLPIELEKGWYAGRAVGDRTCKVCENGDVEDEYHLLFECGTYTTNRIDWLDKLLLSVAPSRDDWSVIFNKPYLLEKFLKTVMELRTKTLLTKSEQ